MAKLKPRARIIRTIGSQLISGPEAAMIELVKNAYDADSALVDITIIPPNQGSLGLVRIHDKGHGMSFDEILNNWLEPATDNKQKNSISKSGKRVVLGAKGIGRFACSVLGDKLTLTSVAQVGDKFEKSILNIDWRVFDDNKYLDEIDIDIQKEILDESSELGVSLEITSFKVEWNKKRVAKLIRELRRLSVRESSDSSFSIFLNIEAFRKSEDSRGLPHNFDGVELLEEENQSFTDDGEINLILPYSIGEECDYRVEGKFDDLGGFTGVFTILRGDRQPQDLVIPAPTLEGGEINCSEFSIDLKIFDLDSDSIKGLFKRLELDFDKFGLRGARSFLSKRTGVAIYRSGFRIRPYGDPENDWLRLEKRRVQQPSKKIGHNQIAGAIGVASEGESNLVERSSREGLEHNGSFDRLTNLVTKLLERVESKRLSYREKAGLSRKTKANSIKKARDIASLGSITQAVQSLTIEEQRPILLKIEKESKALTKTLDEIEAYQKLLESRAALGMVVAQLVHDGRTYLSTITTKAKSLIDNSPFLLDNNKKGELVRKYYPSYGKDIQVASKGLSALFKALDPVSGRRRGRPVDFSILKVVDNTLALMEEDIIEYEITVVTGIQSDLMAYGYEGDLQAALMNIIQNAIYWHSTVDHKNKRIEISGTKAQEYAQISILNNGPKIDESDIDKLFEAGFSLKSNGHGLGLVISREACRNSKGDLYFLPESEDPYFVIEFPLSDKDK